MVTEDHEVTDQEYLLMDKELIPIRMEPFIMNTAPVIAIHMPVSLYFDYLSICLCFTLK